MLKQKLGIKVFSRAHGYDLYEDRIDPPFIPSRASLLSKVDHVFPDSRRGSEYLTSNYSEHFFKITTAYMGTQDPGFTVRQVKEFVCYRFLFNKTSDQEN